MNIDCLDGNFVKSFMNKSPLVILLVISIFQSIYWTDKKSGYYVDEGLTLIQNNGDYNGAITTDSSYDFYDFVNEYILKNSKNPFVIVENVIYLLKNRNNTENGLTWFEAGRSKMQGNTVWRDGQYLFNQITAEKNRRFNYGKVYINYAVDTHPPIYGFIVHTIFSLFPDTYSKWYMAFVNITFMSFASILLYFLLLRRYNCVCLAFLCTGLFCFSQGFYSCVVFYRMYALQAFFVVSTLYIHNMLLNNPERFFSKKANVFLLAINVLLGFLTQYFFIVFLFSSFLITLFKLNKQHKSYIWQYFFINFLAGMISVVIWPFSLYHIFFGWRSNQISKLAGNYNFVSKITMYIKYLADAFTFGNIYVFFILFGIIISGFVLNVWGGVKQKKNNQLICIPLEWWCPVLIFTLIVSQVSSPSDRYLMPVYPVVALCLGIAIYKAIKFLIKSDYVFKILTVIITVAYFVLTLCITNPNYLYLTERNLSLPTFVDDKSNYDCLFIAPEHCAGATNIVKLSEFNQILVLGTTTGEMKFLCRPQIAAKSGMVIYIYEYLRVDDVLKTIIEALNVSDIIGIDSDIREFNAFLVAY